VKDSIFGLLTDLVWRFSTVIALTSIVALGRLGVKKKVRVPLLSKIVF